MHSDDSRRSTRGQFTAKYASSRRVAYRSGCFNSHTLYVELCISARKHSRARFGRVKQTFISRIDHGFSALIQLMLIIMMMHANNGAARERYFSPRRKCGDVRWYRDPINNARLPVASSTTSYFLVRLSRETRGPCRSFGIYFAVTAPALSICHNVHSLRFSCSTSISRSNVVLIERSIPQFIGIDVKRDTPRAANNHNANDHSTS